MSRKWRPPPSSRPRQGPLNYALFYGSSPSEEQIFTICIRADHLVGATDSLPIHVVLSYTNSYIIWDLSSEIFIKQGKRFSEESDFFLFVSLTNTCLMRRFQGENCHFSHWAIYRVFSLWSVFQNWILREMKYRKTGRRSRILMRRRGWCH